MPASRPEDRRFDSSWGSISLEVPLGPPACDPATWPAHHQPLLVVDLCDRGLQVVHGHLPLSLAVDVRRWTPSISAMGDTLSMYDSVATGIMLLQKSLRISVCAKVMMLGKRASVSEKLGPKRTVHFTACICYVTEGGLLPYHS